ncbi:putative transposase, Ptta/En/Spm, plant [Helianthus debilis subsp. tardiflorus]
MWKFVFLVMMVLTRTMPEEDSRGPTNQSVAIESASNIVPCSTRRRKRNAATTTDVDQPQVDPQKRRGPNLNLSATKDFENLPEGSKIALTMAGGTKGFVGKTATQFANEIGIVVRSGKFNLLRTDRAFMGYVDYRLHRQWTRTRGELSAHWKKNGGKTNPRLARSMMKSNCRSLEDWNHLCDYWELESTRKYSDQMELNRGKQAIASRGGSRSIANHVFHMTNRETQTPPSPFEVYYKLHYNAKKGWLNDEAKSEYENIIHHKEEAVAKLISEGTTITTTMDHELKKEAIESVCAKEKTTKSAWKVGVGPVFRKKDFWMTSEAGSSQLSSSEAEALRNQVALLEEKLKQSNEKSEKVLMFMSSKFPDFESSLSAHMRGGANDLDGQLNDNDSLI